MHKRVLVLILLLVGLEVSAQHDRCWVFGDSSYLEFGPTGPVVFPIVRTTTHYEMGSSISDINGNFLFHVDQDSIYDIDRKALTGKSGMLNNGPSNPLESITQGALILPDPGNIYNYWIFAMARNSDASFNWSLATWLVKYSNGNSVPTLLGPDTLYRSNPGITEKMTAVQHSDGKSWWVVIHQLNNNVFQKYLLSPQGLQGPFLQTIGPTLSGPQGWGQTVFSPSGNKYASVSPNNNLDLFDFNRCTGEFTNWVTLKDTTTDPEFHYLYGCSFSPDGSKLFASEIGEADPNKSIQVVQFDLNSPDIYASRTQILPDIFYGDNLGQHRLGPDGKIYIAHQSGTVAPQFHDTHLTVINNPNAPGLACNAVYAGFDLQGRRSTYQLPNLPYFGLGPIMAQTAEIGADTLWVCPGDSIQLGDFPDTTGGAIVWSWTSNQGNGGLSAQNVPQPWASPNTTTTYYVSAEDTTLSIACTITYDSVVVVVLGQGQFPVANAGLGGNLCLGDSVLLGTTDPSGGIWQYSWTPSSTLSGGDVAQPLAFPGQPYTYTLTVTDPRVTGIPGGCATDTDSVRLTADRIFSHLPAHDTVFCPGEFISIGPQPEPGFAYEWSPVEWLQDAHEARTNANPPTSMTYRLEITNLNAVDVEGCKTIPDSVTLTASDCLYPNVITPNGDGINDALDFGKHFHLPEISVYDRWGGLVYHSDHYQNDWIPTATLPEGVYYYMIREATALQPVVGVVTIVR